jgi:hypothetical protein
MKMYVSIPLVSLIMRFYLPSPAQYLEPMSFILAFLVEPLFKVRNSENTPIKHPRIPGYLNPLGFIQKI